MTKQEFQELYDLLFYGHDVELTLSGQHYFLEWNKTGIDIFLIHDNTGSKISSISKKHRKDTITTLFDFKLDGYNCLNAAYADIEIVDIE